LCGAENGHCGEKIKYAWEVLKWDVGEGLIRSVGQIV
jgi:hypothetical protein